MPIRINLLAEAKAQEDLRRRDPLKRALFVGAAFVAAMLVWSLLLWMKSMTYKSELAQTEKLVEMHSAEHKDVLSNLKQTGDISQKITALQKLSRDRLLVGNMLDALQRINVPDVQLARFRLDEILTYNEEVKPDSETKRAAKPASVTEKISVTLDAKDASAKPGDLIPKFQQAVADAPYFVAALDKSDPQRVRLKPGSFGPQQTGPDGRPFQPFTLECFFPDKTR